MGFLELSVTSIEGHITMSIKAPTHKMIDLEHMRIGLHEWGNSDGKTATLVLVHATGFHGRTWDKVIQQLPTQHIIAIDLRGHGHSDAIPFDSWYDFGADIAATLRKLGLTKVVLVGHSLGGFACVIAAHLEPNIVEKLLLIDPVILPPPVYQGYPVDMQQAARATKARQAEFPSVESMIDRYREREPFALFDHEVFDDYCRHGLVWNEHKQAYTLACDPSFEATIYPGMASYSSIYSTLEQLDQRVHVLRARQAPRQDRFYGFTYSPTYPQLVEHLKNGVDIPLEEHSHFIPQQDPLITAKHIQKLLEE
ncbi:MAG: hypothetical protein RL336_1607 [Pseudomonadota bacterium]|jgi:pimeloyl-ACP methyl ester carboxylesterase